MTQWNKNKLQQRITLSETIRSLRKRTTVDLILWLVLNNLKYTELRRKKVKFTKICVDSCGWTSNASPSLGTRNGYAKEIFTVGFQIYDGFLRRRYFNFNLSPLPLWLCTALKIRDHIVGKILSWIVVNRSPLHLKNTKETMFIPQFIKKKSWILLDHICRSLSPISVA